MKKLMSSLMIGLIATTATMSAMAAPAQDHRNPPPVAHFDKKPMPPKGDFRKDAPRSDFKKNDRHDKFDKKDHRGKFDKKDHKGFVAKGKMHKQGPDRKGPPMPPKHR